MFTNKGSIFKWIFCERPPLRLIFASALICISNNDLGKMHSLLMTFADDKTLGEIIV